MNIVSILTYCPKDNYFYYNTVQINERSILQPILRLTRFQSLIKQARELLT